MYQFDYIILKGAKSPANFSLNYIATKQISNVRFIDSYNSELPTPTDVEFRTLNHINSTNFVNIQSRKTIEHEIKVEFTEKFDNSILTECDKISIVDRNGFTFDVILKDANYEKQSGTTLSVATFTFTQILDDEDAVSSFVCSDFVKERADNGDFGGADIYLSLTSDKTIGGDTVSDLRFYTLFFPKINRETVLENKTLTKTKTGNEYTIQTYDCQTVRLKLFLNDVNLAIFKKYIHRCYYQIDSVNYGVSINFRGTTYTASQTINEGDVAYNEDAGLIDLTEIDITLRNDFLKHEL
jgi:hypothetical protein